MRSLHALSDAGSLHCYTPSIPSVPTGKRWLWLTKSAEEWRKNPGRDFYEDAVAMAIAQLDSFVNGELMEENIDIKLLKPTCRRVWEIRTLLSPDKRQIRMFGWFPCPKHFVLVHVKPRQWLGNDSAKWEKSIQTVTKVRNTLLPGISLCTSNYQELVG